MTSRDFCFWLQGYFEISKPEVIPKANVEMIQRHLNLVFKHEIDPSYTSDKDKQEEMQVIHDPPQKFYPTTFGPSEPVFRC